MKVRDLMSYPIVIVRPDSTVFDVIKNMVGGEKGSMLVAGEGLLKEVEGIVTVTGIFRRVFAKGLDPAKVTVSEIMTPAPLITISPNASTKEAAKLMKANHVRKLPVVEEDALVGIITSEDLLGCVE
ncbi:MAG: CBS domain-containing protein [Euryarchaeota archaeon]|nr:CBS domain-containing protein [Euryarchaeota archaeon]